MIALIFSTFWIGCAKNDVEQPKSQEVKLEKVQLSQIKFVDEKYKNFDNFLKSESFQILKASLPTFEIKSIQAASFDNKSVLGFVVSINDLNGYTRDLMTVYRVDDPFAFTTMIREHSVKNVGGKLSGEVFWYDASYERINEMVISNDKISHFKIYTSGEPFSLKNARINKQDCIWICSVSDFNCEIKRARDECENDLTCNIACSFNPCIIAYVAAAAVNCTVCNQ